jgi:hypothetical protein
VKTTALTQNIALVRMAPLPNFKAGVWMVYFTNRTSREGMRAAEIDGQTGAVTERK